MASNKIDDYSEFTTTEDQILASNCNDYQSGFQENVCFSQKASSFHNKTFENKKAHKRIMTAVNRNRNTLKPYKNMYDMS